MSPAEFSPRPSTEAVEPRARSFVTRILVAAGIKADPSFVRIPRKQLIEAAKNPALQASTQSAVEYARQMHENDQIIY